MPIDQQLEQELNAWRSAGLTAKFRWRDDDAITDTPQLRRVLSISHAKRASCQPSRLFPNAPIRHCAPCSHRQSVVSGNMVWAITATRQENLGRGPALDLMCAMPCRGNRPRSALRSRRLAAPFVPPFHLLSMRFKSLIPSLGYRGVSAGVS